MSESRETRIKTLANALDFSRADTVPLEMIKKITRRSRDEINKTSNVDAILLVALVLGVKLD